MELWGCGESLPAFTGKKLFGDLEITVFINFSLCLIFFSLPSFKNGKHSRHRNCEAEFTAASQRYLLLLF